MAELPKNGDPGASKLKNIEWNKDMIKILFSIIFFLIFKMKKIPFGLER